MTTAPFSSPARPASAQLTLRGLTMRFADRVVLDRLDLTAAPGERIGVIGDNGSGKTTLLRVIAGELEPTAGDLHVVAPGGMAILRQAIELPDAATVQDAIDACWAQLRALEDAIRDAESALGGFEGRALEDALADYARLIDRFEARGGYEASARLDAARQALGVADLALDREWRSLSGGERSRTALAAVVASNAELLLLDEPTNDLDDAAWEWLLAALRRHRGTVVAVTHDRAFLSALTEVVWHVDGGRVERHGNGYSGFLNWKAAERERQRLAYEAWCDELARHESLLAANAGRLDAIPRKLAKAGMGAGAFRMRGRDHGAMGRIRNAKERIDRLRDASVAPPPEPLVFAPRLGRGDDHPASEPGAPVLRLSDVRAARLKLDELSLGPSERLLLTGPNGVGKSTLLRLIAGEVPPTDRSAVVSGEVHVTGRVGHLRQQVAPVGVRAEPAAPPLTVLAAYATGIADTVDEAEGRLDRLGLFRREEWSMPVPHLSYGQRRRLELALLVSRPVDLLLLDEPTNHLSPDLAEDLERALAGFDGAVVVVSHDRMLRQRFAGRRLAISADGAVMAS